MAENSGFYWGNTKRYADDLIKLQEQDGVNVYRTPDSVMAAQLEAWDKVTDRICGRRPVLRQGDGIPEGLCQERHGLSEPEPAGLQARLQALLRLIPSQTCR
jgi:hypothetical protein